MVFFDTNILIYRFDTNNTKKQTIANKLIGRHYGDKSAVISTQVVQEFINVCISKFTPKYSTAQVNFIIKDLLQPMCQHSPSFLYYQKALQLYYQYSLSFYDVLIIQAAIDTNCTVLYSEDLQDGQTFGKLTVINPFKAS